MCRLINKDVSEGAYGYVVKITSPNGTDMACKVFKRGADPEIEFLGVDFDHKNKTMRLNVPRRKTIESILKTSGFVPTLLKTMTNTCTLCRRFSKCHHASTLSDDIGLDTLSQNILSTKRHYHVFMPWLDGNLEQYMRANTMSMTERLDIFLQVSKVSHNLAQHGIFNTDLKLSNILYSKRKNQTLKCYPCDVGGLYHLGKEHVEYVNDPFKRIMITDGKRYRIIGKVDAYDSDKYEPCQPHETSQPHLWAVATSVNIYLKLEDIKSNFDLSPVSHLTNQFSVLAFLMVMIGMKPPYHDIIKNKHSLHFFFSKFPTIENYIYFFSSSALRNHVLYYKLRSVILKVWHQANDWKLYGNETNYIQNLRQDIKHILASHTSSLHVTKHTTPPCKVRRITELNTQTRSCISNTDSQKSIHSHVIRSN